MENTKSIFAKTAKEILVHQYDVVGRRTARYQYQKSLRSALVTRLSHNNAHASLN